MAFPSRAEFIWPFSSGTVCTCCWNFGALCIGGVGNKKIWTLIKTDGNPTGWSEVGEMKEERRYFSAMTLKLDKC